MKPFTTRTNPAQSSLKPYESAQRTLEHLDTLITDSGIEPSKTVLAARADIKAIATEEAEQLADVDNLRAHAGLSTTAALEVLTRGARDTTINDAERYQATATLLTGSTRETAKEYRRLENQVIFYRTREAANRLRALGDDILDGLLQPWLDRIMIELKPLATVLAEGGWEAIYATAEYKRINFDDTADLTDDIRAHATMPTKVRPHFEIMRAQQLTAEVEHVALVAHELREHGFIPRADDPDFPNALYAWRHPERLPYMKYTTHTADSAALWIAQAIAAGATPAARSARQAEAARPLPPIDIGQ